MGVPAFFRWLSKKYPSIVVQCDEGVQQDYKFDNLYLDMNGIIHPCTHPENKPPPENEAEMFLAIYDYIERIMRIVKPKKLLYMAVDGVAPRAKMNQQRSRRFRASHETIQKKIEIQKIKDDLLNRGIIIEESEKKSHFDSNVITPGTQFMINLSIALRGWIDTKLSAANADPDGIWPKDLVVILSDASVPGEGEHKIMEYIRKQKAMTNYNPNISHCLCGADADLIMLGLATHELNFTILREEFIPNQPRPCEICAQYGHEMKDCEGAARDPDAPPFMGTEPGFIYIRLNVLREYLEKESGEIDLERFIDDFVFLCFFVGNDFLPHLPSLEIREGAIDRLLKIYRDIMARTGKTSYLTDSGLVDLGRVQHVLDALGQHEDNIFKQRKDSDRRFNERRKRQKLQNRGQNMNSAWHRPEAVNRNQAPSHLDNTRQEATQSRLEGFANANPDNLSAAQRLKAMLREPGAADPAETPRSQPAPQVKRPLESDSEPEDLVDLGDDGWKERYYYHKFDCVMHSNISAKVAQEYVLGLCWVLRYYYQGCPDWQWFYPYHYAPFASDFENIADMDIQFKYDAKPFKPLEQLMSVFPAASSDNLPPSWRRLMTDRASPIVDFYPLSFKIDLNGKKAAWMGVALLPFIDEERLAKALKEVYPNLSEDEKDRNSLGGHLLFVSKGNKSASEFLDGVVTADDVSVEVNPQHFDGMGGTVSKSRFGENYKETHCVEYSDPSYPKEFVFKAVRLADAKVPPTVLKPEDFVGEFRPTIGMTPHNQQGYMGQAGKRMMNNAMSSAYGGYQGQGRQSQQAYGQNSNNYRQPPFSNQRGGHGGGQSWNQGNQRQQTPQYGRGAQNQGNSQGFRGPTQNDPWGRQQRY